MTNNKPTLTMMVGLPQSGKSTWVKQNKCGRVVISADILRELIYGHRYYAIGEDLMWSIRGLMLHNLMGQGIDLIIDETNTTIERRKKIITLAQKYNYDVGAIHISTAYVLCTERALYVRDYDLLPVIERMAAQFEPPTLEEGFTGICTVG